MLDTLRISIEIDANISHEQNITTPTNKLQTRDYIAEKKILHNYFLNL